MVPSSDPVATSDPGTAEAGGRRKLLLDEMLAEKARPPLPPAPVLTVEPAPVDAASAGGLLGARKRLAEVEALARRNLRAAEEARRVVFQERQLLEEEASARTAAERTASALRREIERLRATEEQRAAQARFAATNEARSELATEIERVHEEHARVVDELDRMRGTLFDHDSLLDEYSRRLREEQEAQAVALGAQTRAEEAQRVAERNLEIAIESARRRGDEELARFTQVETAWREACTERDRVTAELQAITNGDGELVRLPQRARSGSRGHDPAHERARRAGRAGRRGRDRARRGARSRARRPRRSPPRRPKPATSPASRSRRTRSELAEKAEALDAQRSTSQARIADLTAQLATATRTAESATERSADLEARLDAAIAARDEAVATAETRAPRARPRHVGHRAAPHAGREHRRRARGDPGRAREVAGRAADGTHGARAIPRGGAPGRARRPQAAAAVAVAGCRRSWTSRRPTATPRRPRARARVVARAHVVRRGTAPSAFGTELRPQRAAAVAEPEAEPEADAEAEPVVAFRIAEDPDVVRVRAGGPVVELEASMVRGIEPLDAPPAEDDETEDATVEATPEPSPESQAWRRTAMAALSSLAGDSDDLTPNRRR